MNAKTLATLAVGIALPTSALAWKHTRNVWMPTELPFDYYISSYEEDSLPVGYQVEAIQNAYAAWLDAECADVPNQYNSTEIPNVGYTYDEKNYHTFDDPADELAPGVLAATLTRPVGGEIAFIFEGQAYYRSLDSDIVFNDNVYWGTEEQIEGSCGGRTSIQSVATHEIGHQLGMGHSCDDGETCTDPDLLEATMFWQSGACTNHQATINVDDIQGITAIYGPYASFNCDQELNPGDDDTLVLGNAPFELSCTVNSDDNPTGATWYFGDGGTSEEIDGSHTYEEPGNYTVRVCFEGTSDICGEWEYCYRREGYVTVCDEPDVQFDVQHLNGLEYQLHNETDLSVYGCIHDVQWDIYQGSDLLDSVNAWEPNFDFPEAGDYKIVLTVSGPAGESTQELEVEIKKRRAEGYGCSTLGAAGGSGLFALLGALAVPIRRRRR